MTGRQRTIGALINEAAAWVLTKCRLVSPDFCVRCRFMAGRPDCSRNCQPGIAFSGPRADCSKPGSRTVSTRLRLLEGRDAFPRPQMPNKDSSSTSWPSDTWGFSTLRREPRSRRAEARTARDRWHRVCSAPTLVRAGVRRLPKRSNSPPGRDSMSTVTRVCEGELFREIET